MRKSLWIPLLLLVALTVGVARLSRPAREYTTSSDQAYKLYEQGDEQRRAFQWGAAEKSLKEALRLDPKFAMAEAALADLYGSMGRQKECMRAVRTADSLALRIPGEIERWSVQLRLSNLDQGLLARRDSLYALLAPRRPRSRIVMVTKAMMAATRHDVQGEIAAWQEVVKAEPNDADAYNLLGYLSARQGRYDEAKSYLKKYAFLAPQLANPHDSLGEILTYGGDYEEAERELKQALTIQPEFFPSLINLGLVYIDEGQVAKGVQLLEKVRQMIAGTEWEKRVDTILLQTYYNMDLRPQLVASVKSWLERNPKDSMTAYYHALDVIFAQKWGGVDQAIADMVAAAKRQPYYSRSPSYQTQVMANEHLMRALVARERGDHAAAAAECAQALELEKDAPPFEIWSWKCRYATELLALGRNAEALDQAREVLAYNPRRLPALLLEARAQHALGRDDDARATVTLLRKDLVKADPNLAMVAGTDSLATALGVRPPA